MDDDGSPDRKGMMNRGHSDGTILESSTSKESDYNRTQSEKVMSVKEKESHVNANLELQLPPTVDSALISRLPNNKSKAALRRGSMEHQITRQQIARARWVHATWWALQVLISFSLIDFPSMNVCHRTGCSARCCGPEIECVSTEFCAV
jgi:hypothetical protein